DMWIVCRTVPPDERARFITAVTRTRAQIAFVRVPPNANVAALMDYWGVGSREHVRNVRALLSSASHAENGATFSLFNLLPKLPRHRLNTFPAEEEADLNCYWSTLNFFSDRPQERWLDVAAALAALAADYHEVPESGMRFGDVIVLEDASRQI